ncbi:CLUMA_CG010858, isoform A [Clunio marinus]|uniref:CLUMA_CG010858, isoform A n=1 Tax=Clunio marinus TaxID=568069 RepID=A0A1J1IB08_9DIPT|nr:CLUMA_CG010858, isoform A [Clunio marinus]
MENKFDCNITSSKSSYRQKTINSIYPFVVGSAHIMWAPIPNTKTRPCYTKQHLISLESLIHESKISTMEATVFVRIREELCFEVVIIRAILSSHANV